MLGARIEHLGPWTDRHNNGLATFSPSLYKQQCTEAIGSPVSCAATTDYPGHRLARSAELHSELRQHSAVDLLLAARRHGLGHLRPRQHRAAWRLGHVPPPGGVRAVRCRGCHGAGIQDDATCSSSGTLTASMSSRRSILQTINIDVLSTTDTERPIIYQYNGTISQTDQHRHIQGSFEELAGGGGVRRHDDAAPQLVQQVATNTARPPT